MNRVSGPTFSRRNSQVFLDRLLRKRARTSDEPTQRRKNWRRRISSCPEPPLPRKKCRACHVAVIAAAHEALPTAPCSLYIPRPSSRFRDGRRSRSRSTTRPPNTLQASTTKGKDRRFAGGGELRSRVSNVAPGRYKPETLAGPWACFSRPCYQLVQHPRPAAPDHMRLSGFLCKFHSRLSEVLVRELRSLGEALRGRDDELGACTARLEGAVSDAKAERARQGARAFLPDLHHLSRQHACVRVWRATRDMCRRDRRRMLIESSLLNTRWEEVGELELGVIHLGGYRGRS